MGSGASTPKQTIIPLQCPKDYDEKDFAKILRLYDTLDVNGNLTVELDELSQMAIHHVNNRKKILEIKLTQNKALLQNSLLQYKLELDEKIKSLEKKYNEKVALEKTLSCNNEKLLNKQIKELNNLTLKEKKEKLLRNITDENDEIDFWKFFKYMKNKVSDIDNICWSPINCNSYRKSSLSITVPED